jgi:hypothetical protein
MIESLIRHQNVENHLQLALLGALYVLVAAFFADIVFRPFASVAVVFLSVLACIPYVDALITNEETKLAKFRSGWEFLREYSHVTVGLLWLFMGLVVGFLALFFIVQAWFPSEFTPLFSFQQSTLTAIAGPPLVTGHAVQPVTLENILRSNGIVFLLSLALALCYTFGSVTILAWNASMLGYALAQWTVNNAAQVTTAGALGIGFIRYFIHGIPEIGAYVVVGLAGGIMSVAFANHDIWSKKWKTIVGDALKLVLIAALLLVAGALIEVYITPLLYQG